MTLNIGVTSPDVVGDLWKRLLSQSTGDKDTIPHVETDITENRHITVCLVPQDAKISVGSAHKVIHDHLHLQMG